jgi:hypothetical protein
MSRVALYSSNNVDVIFGGLALADGRGDPFFQLAPNGPAFTTEGPGADGHITRNKTNNNLYTITLTFKGTSAEHAKLSALFLADRVSENGVGVAPLLVKDSNGSTLIATDQCWIATFNELGFGVGKPDIAWELHAVIQPAALQLGGA